MTSCQWQKRAHMTFSDRLRRLRDKGGPNEITQIDLGIAMGYTRLQQQDKPELNG